MVREIAYTTTPGVANAIASLGRTEDLRFSPSSRRLVVAGFTKNRITVFDVAINVCGGGPRITLTGGAELASPALQQPHGLDFIDDDTLITTSRGSGVAVFELPLGDRDVRSHEVHPILSWPADAATLLKVPSAVSVTRVDNHIYQILICNNDGHSVTRHLLDRDANVVTNTEILLHKYLDVPDGVSVSPDRRWIAVSNHGNHNVLLYENSKTLSAEAKPDGVLRGAYYPHGLRFSADGRYLFVADAGAPHLHIYAQHAEEWRGVRHPLVTVRVMDDAVFQRGRHNPQEGGPKGLDIDTDSNVLVVTSECQPLAFFDGAALVRHAIAAGSGREQRDLDISYELSLMQEKQAMVRTAMEQQALQNSRSWKVAALLRRVNSTLRRHTSRA
jgi:hypothetical protein